MSGVIASLLPAIDSILGVRDTIGAVKQPVYFITRTWYVDGTFAVQSSQVGEGVAQDVQVQMLPSPAIVSFAQDLRVKEGGSVKSGDILLKYVSANSYTEALLDGSSPAQNIEKFYLVGVKLYQVINVVRDYVYFNVQLRELSNQTRY